MVLLDWQSVCVAKGIRDFAYLISHGMSVDDRREHEETLVRQYVDGVNAYGIDYRLDDARHDYVISMVALIQIIDWITGVHVNPHESARRRKSALVERAFTAMLDHRAFDVLADL